MAYPVVLIHGMWCTPRNWDRIVELLGPRGYDCHAPALPAHEPVPDQPIQVGAKSITEYADFIAAYIAQQNFPVPPVLIGHSMGGWIAQAVATRVQPLATVLLTPAAPTGIFGLRFSNVMAFLPHFLRWGFWRKSHALLRARCDRWATNGLPAAQQEKIFSGLLHESGRAASELGFSFFDWTGAAKVDAAALHCPVYVVSAGADGLVPPGVVKRVAARYPQATLRVYPGRSHWVIDDAQTEDMVHEFAGWLQPLVQRAARLKAA